MSLIHSPIEQIAKDFFHIDGLYDLQQEIIDSILKRKDNLIVLPTGGGKSITFQIPSLIQDGLTLVITPLISLMKDQVRTLKDNYHLFPCEYISSEKSKEEIENTMNHLKEIKLLYITPERIISPAFLDKLIKNNITISLIVVDEAHCISLWGNSFRPSYLKITDFTRHFPGVPIAAYTATATEKIIKDIKHYLKMRDPVLWKKSSYRDNISIKFQYVDDKTQYLIDNLKQDVSTIIYTNSRFICNNLSYLIEKHGFSSTYYHAGLSKKERELNQNSFMKNQKNIMIATSAFGMGIDKKDIRFIYHYDIPIEIEEYVQEIGRAGRDGGLSTAVTLVNLDDFNRMDEILNDRYPNWSILKQWLNDSVNNQTNKEKLQTIFDSINSDPKINPRQFKKYYLLKRKRMIFKISLMKEFISSSLCRAVFLQKQFDETLTVCKKCDFCETNKRITLSEMERIIFAILSFPKVKWDLKHLHKRAVLFSEQLGQNKKKYHVISFIWQDFIKAVYTLKNKNLLKIDPDTLKVSLIKIPLF